MANRFFPCSTIAGLVVSATCLMPGVGQTQTLQTHLTPLVRFETPTGFSSLQPLGRETLGVIYPASSSTGVPQFVIRLAVLDSEFTFSDINGQEAMGLIKHRFLGISTPAQTYQQRQFLGQTIQGEVQMQRTYQGVVATEIYVVPLSVGRKLMIAFEADTQMPLMQVENIINTVASTLEEVPQED